MTKLPAVLALTLSLAACGGIEERFDTPPLRADAPSSAPLTKVPSRYSRIEVIAVTLPTYAEGEEIHVRGASGAITPLGPLWADEPGRGVTQQIARDLDAITGRLVAPEPWPFRDLPNVRVDIRIQDFYATEAGTFRVSGLAFVAPEEAGPDRSTRFEIETPIAGEGGPADIAAARAAAVSELAVFVARNGLR